MAKELKINITGDGRKLDAELTKAASEVAKLERQSKQAKNELNNLNRSVSGVVGGLGNLSNAFRSGNITSFATGITGLGGSLQGLIPIFGSVGTAGASMGTMLNAALGPIGLITAAIGAIGAVTVGAIKSFSDFETHLDQLQSLTGLDDSSMKAVSDGAIEMSKNFRASASDIVDSMKLIGSQAPQLLSNKEALMAVTESANVLAEAAGIEVVDAAKGITTVMNQMGVDASKASEIINVLAAASQKGSADVAYLNSAFEKAGTVANNAGLSYQQLAGAVETIAPKFSSAEVAGTSLSAMFKALEKQADDSIKPSVVGIEQALDNLAKKNLSTADTIKLFGDTGYVAADALIKQREEFSQLTDAISGTDTAFEQMRINNDNLAGAFNSLKSQFEACLLQFAQTEYIQGMIDMFKEVMAVVGHCIKVVFDLVQAIMKLPAVKALIAAIVIVWKAVWQAIDNVITIVEVIVALWNKGMNFMKGLINKFYNSLQNNAVFKWFKEKIQAVINWALKLVNKVKEIWNKFLEWIGLGGNGGNITISTDLGDNTGGGAKLDESTAADSAPTAGSGGGKGRGKGNGKGSGKGSTGKGSDTTTTNKIDYETGSLRDYETQLQKLNEELNKTNVSEDRLKQINKEKETLEKQIETLKIRNGLADEKPVLVEGSANYINEQINKKQTELNNLVIGSDGWTKLKEEIETLQASLKVEPKLPEGSLAYIEKQLQEKEAKLKLAVVGSEAYKQLADEIAKLTGEKKTIQLQIDTDTLDEATKKTNDLKEAQERAKDIADKNSQVFSSLSNTFSSLGSAVGGTAGKVLEMAGATMQAVSEIIPQVVALIGAKEAEALAGGTASAASLPFPANMAAIASIVATVTALFASFAGKFADGGIIKGATSLGDFNIARVNSGEMILNNRQQGRLFKMLDGNGFYSNDTTSNGSVTFKIQGKELVGVLSNYNQKINKVR